MQLLPVALQHVSTRDKNLATQISASRNAAVIDTIWALTYSLAPRLQEQQPGSCCFTPPTRLRLAMLHFTIQRAVLVTYLPNNLFANVDLHKPFNLHAYTSPLPPCCYTCYSSTADQPLCTTSIPCASALARHSTGGSAQQNISLTAASAGRH